MGDDQGGDPQIGLASNMKLRIIDSQVAAHAGILVYCRLDEGLCRTGKARGAPYHNRSQIIKMDSVCEFQVLENLA